MQPYVNPNYFNQYPYQQQFAQTMQPVPYVDRYSQMQAQQNMQQPQAQPMAIGINGRIVDDFSVITANDVPMDGNGAIFVKKDGSEIQIRNWTAQGTIATSRFKPFSEPDAVKVSTDTEKAAYEDVRAVLGGIQSDIQVLNEKIDKISKPAASGRAKKEGNADE